MIKSRVENNIFIGISVIFFFITAIIFVFNGDDIAYQYSFDNGTRIESSTELINSQIAHYKTMNGRIIPHLIGQLILAIPYSNIIFACFISFIFAILLYAIYIFSTLANPNRAKTTRVFPIIMSTLAFFYVLPGRMWEISYMMVELNYTLSAYIIILFLISLYRTESIQQYPKRSIVYSIGLFFLGLSAGITHEAIVVALGGGLFFIYIRLIKKINYNSLILLIGFVIGACILVFSPGIIHRANDSGTLTLNWKEKVINTALMFYHLKFFFVLIIAMFVLRLKNKGLFSKFIQMNKLLLSSIATGIIFTIFLAKLYYTNDRAIYGIELFSFLSLLRLVTLIPFTPFMLKLERVASYVFLCLFIVHQAYIVPISFQKWDIHRQVRKNYLSSETGVVAYPKYNYPKWIDNFTIDLSFNYYDGMGTHFSQVEQKLRKEKRNDDIPLTALNEDLYNNLRDNSTSNRLFSEKYKIKTNSSASFYTKNYYNVIVSKYDSTLLQLLANKTLHYTLAPASSQDP